MPHLWKNITRKDVLKALALFDQQRAEAPAPRNTLLVYKGKKYPAKHLRGMAYQLANGQAIAKSAYSGGAQTARFFQRLDFTVQYKSEVVAKKEDKPLIGTKSSRGGSKSLVHHKIARLVVRGRHCDRQGLPTHEGKKALVNEFLSRAYGRQRFDFVVAPGGFLHFRFPKALSSRSREELEACGIAAFQSVAEEAVTAFFNRLGQKTRAQFKEAAKYFTLGIDGGCTQSALHVELVALYDLKADKVLRWTGKFYPTEAQKSRLVRILELPTHCLTLNGQKVVLLGCHDLSVYNPRGQAAAAEGSWKKMMSRSFKKMVTAFGPDIVLQHPHATDTPNIWNLAWRSLEKELPGVQHFVSGINYHYPGGRPRGALQKVLHKTKKGDVHDF